jgi:hypothetical protein
MSHGLFNAIQGVFLMSDPIQDATSKIESRLETGFLNPVTHSDIKAVTDEIKALPADQAGQLIDELMADGTLNKIADKAMVSSMLNIINFGGLDSNERQEFFADMVGKLDGDGLRKLSTAFAQTDEMSGRKVPVTEIGSSVATHAGPQTKLDYIAALTPDIGSGGRPEFGYGFSHISYSDPEARAVGEVLGSMRGAYAEEAFTALGTHLPDVLTSSINAQLNTTFSSGGPSLSMMTWNADTYETIMDAAASMSDVGIKAQVFNAGVDVMRSLRDPDTSIGGGTSRGKDEVLDQMADGLARIIGSLGPHSNAFTRPDGPSGGLAPITEISSTVAAHTYWQVKLDYITALAPNIDNKFHSDIGFGYSTISHTDAEAVAVIEVLSTMRGSNAEEAFTALGSHLPDVLISSLNTKMNSVTSPNGMSAMTISWDAGSYEAIMYAAASMSDADLKAQIFDAGVDAMRSVRDTNLTIGGLTPLYKPEAMDKMIDALTTIIDSDTSGVMRELTFNGATRDGSDFAAYAKEMLNQGGEAHLGAQMARLQMGNRLTANPVDRLNQTEIVPNSNNQTRLPQAASLGYFVGSVSAAVKSIDSDVEKQRALTTAILKSTLSIVDKARIGGAATGIAASVGKEWVQFAVAAAIANPHANAATKLAHAALPIDPTTGETGVGSAVMSDFEDTLSYVAQFAEP